MKKLVFIFFIVCFSFNAQAQRWKSYRAEAIFGIGATSFLGELGGANYIGTHLFKDLEWRATRPALNIGFRYKLSEYAAVRPGIYWGYMVGKDKWTKEPYRRYRNLSFGSNVVELSMVYEISFMKEQMGKKYRLRAVRGRRGREMYVFGFIGIGGFWYSPTTKDDNGQRVKLRKLHTEGQSTKSQVLVGSRKQYSGISVNIPAGIAFKYTMDKRWSVSLEYGIRYTFTDYIDDVSTTYVSKSLLESQENNGELAAQMADRSNNGDPRGEGYLPSFSSPGAERGDPRFNDAYMFALITFNYKLRTGRGNLPKF